jgi:hypothetical protein
MLRSKVESFIRIPYFPLSTFDLPLFTFDSPITNHQSPITNHQSPSNPVEANSRFIPKTPSPSGIEELNAVYCPVVAAQVDGACLATGGDPLPDADLFTAAVGVMDDHATELNRRAIDPDSNSLEPAAPAAHMDSVAIHPSIHAGLSQENPAARRLRHPAAGPLGADYGVGAQNQQQPLLIEAKPESG